MITQNLFASSEIKKTEYISSSKINDNTNAILIEQISENSEFVPTNEISDNTESTSKKTV